MQMNVNKNGKYEKLYPKTISTNVEMLDGRNLNQWKQSFEDEFNEIKEGQQTNGVLWSGNGLADADFTINPSKKLNECRNGWVICFKRTSENFNYNYCYVPKEHIQLSSGSTGGCKFVLGVSGNSAAYKYLFVQNNRIVGHESNKTNGNETMEIFSVIEY